VDACVAERTRLDPLLGDALEAIGYETFMRDACRIIDAAKANDPARCAAIDASALEGRCRGTTAQAAGNPDACPWEAETRRALGREPKCVAIASRDVRLCAAVREPRDRASCEGSLLADDRPCGALPARGDQARCVRDVARWRDLLSTSRPSSNDTAGTEVIPSGTLHVEHTDGTGSIDADLGPDLARGVTVFEGLGAARFVVGRLSESGVDFVASSPLARPTLAFEVAVVADRSDSAHPGAEKLRLERAELTLPNRPTIGFPGAQSTLVASSPAPLQLRVRANPVRLVIDGTLGGSGATWRVHAQGTTFIRDIVKAADSLGLGGDAGMR
jgi:hypothetical protein